MTLVLGNCLCKDQQHLKCTRSLPAKIGTLVPVFWDACLCLGSAGLLLSGRKGGRGAVSLPGVHTDVCCSHHPGRSKQQFSGSWWLNLAPWEITCPGSSICPHMQEQKPCFLGLLACLSPAFSAPGHTDILRQWMVLAWFSASACPLNTGQAVQEKELVIWYAFPFQNRSQVMCEHNWNTVVTQLKSE